MFDVSWTDPGGETVGQHRQRKEIGGEKIRESTRAGSIRTTSSSGSSQTNNSSRPKLSGWGLFSGSKKGAGKQQDSRLSSSTSSSNSAPLSISAKTDRGKDVVSRANESRPYERPQTRAELDIQEEQEYHESVQSPSTPVESVFSIPTYRSTRTGSSLGGSVSDMASSGHGRFPPARSHDEHSYMSSDKGYYEDLNSVEYHMSEASISVGDDESEFRVNQIQQFPRAPNNISSGKDGAPSRSSRSNGQMSNSHMRPAAASRQMSASRQPPTKSLPEPPRPGNAAIRLRVRRMEAASPKIILQRLAEEWDEGEDEAIYNEFEFEKQLWMLVGLRYFKKMAASSHPGRLNGALEPCKVLSLYENHACASTLSTMFPIGSKTHHLSMQTPSNVEQISHLHVLIATTPTTTLPYAPSTFATITSLRLPMLLPASSIPSMLGECHRVLTASGTLQLTIMDPAPIAKTVGPIMRAWLDDHLLLKLETQFRCLKPGKLMPIWLEDAGFSINSPSESSGPTVRVTEAMTRTAPTRTSFSFRAIGRGEGGYRGASIEKDQYDTLASTIGRLLWKEIYGPYVVGKSWWWEDEQIVDEAYNMGTKWDVMIIEATKKT